MLMMLQQWEPYCSGCYVTGKKRKFFVRKERKLALRDVVVGWCLRTANERLWASTYTYNDS
jgi:hypothetical protein